MPTHRLRVLLAVASGVLVLGSTLAAAWIASPAPVRLDAHVRARLSSSNGRVLPLSAIAPVMRDAVVATEDERFYRHDGIDVIGVIRALPYDVVHLSLTQGASTITEQLAKVLFLGGNDHTPWRKLEDAAVALKLEGRYSKERILAAYLNSAYFGAGAYGVEAAISSLTKAASRQPGGPVGADEAPAPTGCNVGPTDSREKWLSTRARRTRRPE